MSLCIYLSYIFIFHVSHMLFMFTCIYDVHYSSHKLNTLFFHVFHLYFAYALMLLGLLAPSFLFIYTGSFKLLLITFITFQCTHCIIFSSYISYFIVHTYVIFYFTLRHVLFHFKKTTNPLLTPQIL